MYAFYWWLSGKNESETLPVEYRYIIIVILVKVLYVSRILIHLYTLSRWLPLVFFLLLVCDQVLQVRIQVRIMKLFNLRWPITIVIQNKVILYLQYRLTLRRIQTFGQRRSLDLSIFIGNVQTVHILNRSTPLKGLSLTLATETTQGFSWLCGPSWWSRGSSAAHGWSIDGSSLVLFTVWAFRLSLEPLVDTIFMENMSTRGKLSDDLIFAEGVQANRAHLILQQLFLLIIKWNRRQSTNLILRHTPLSNSTIQKVFQILLIDLQLLVE